MNTTLDGQEKITNIWNPYSNPLIFEDHELHYGHAERSVEDDDEPMVELACLPQLTNAFGPLEGFVSLSVAEKIWAGEIASSDYKIVEADYPANTLYG